MAVINSNVAATATTIFTSTGINVVTTLHLCNQSGATVTANVYVVSNGGVAGVTNLVYKNLNIAAADTYITNNNERFVLGNGDFVAVSSNVANAIIATISTIGA